MNKVEKQILERYNIIAGQSFEAVDLNRLSSAQRARFISWLRENNLSLENGDSVNSDFSREELVPQTIDRIERDIETCAVGTDIQFVPQLFSDDLMDIKSNPEMSGIFSLNEMAFAETREEPILTLAGIFCAKEALIKAGYHGEGSNDLRKLEISHDRNGKPNFHGYSVSISHSKDYAVATAVRLQASKSNRPSPPPISNDTVSSAEQAVEAKHIYNNRGFSKITTILLVLAVSFVISNIELIIGILLS